MRPFAILFLMMFSIRASGQDGWSFDYSATLPYNFPLPLTIRQQGSETLSLTARYRSEPFVVPITWMWKVSYWSDGAAWSLMAIHHKLYLENLPSEVEEFAITHGFNVISVVRSWREGDFILNAGAGIILAHPEVSVRGKRLSESGGILNSGYYVVGPTVNVAIGRRVLLVGGLYVTGDAMVYASYASVPIVDGTASLFSLVGHLSLGLGFTFGS